jgi:7,8-dihydro-6-hydroxymethylpterin dimethyltransferase
VIRFVNPTTPEVVQCSGGEPTIHPQIIDFVKAAKARGIRFVMINTNGRRIAHDDKFVAQLAEVRPSFYFQFDGFDRRTGLALRGEADLVVEKIRALDRLAASGLNVTIVPAIERGVNEYEVGRIVDFAIAHPAIRGINFQPAFHVGRHLRHDPVRRITIPEILELIAAQTAGRFIVSDFTPVPCCFPTCNSVTYAFIDGDRVVPLPRIVNVFDSPIVPSPTSALKSAAPWRGCCPRRRSLGRRSQSTSSRCRVRRAASRTRSPWVTSPST